MKAAVIQKVTRNLPLPGRIVRRLIKFLDKYIKYPDTPTISTAHWGMGQYEITNYREYSQQSIYFLGYYELRESKLLRRLLRPGDIFVDIGANLGWFTVLACKQIGDKGKVFAFEPSASVWTKLNRSIEINNLRNVKPENLALSDETGTVLLSGAIPENSGLSSIVRTNQQSLITAGEQVPVIKFDDYWKRELNQKVRLIKIDVEGAEVKVLDGMRSILQNRLCDYLIVEISDDRLRCLGMSASWALNFLRGCGYKLFHIGMFRLKPIEDDEELHYANILAELRP